MLFTVTTGPSDALFKYKTDWLFWIYFFCKFVQTTYCYIWDIYVDWGLMRNNAKGSKNRFLREKINYHPSFYYWAIFSDFIFRYDYILFWYKLGEEDSMFNNLNTLWVISTF